MKQIRNPIWWTLCCLILLVAGCVSNPSHKELGPICAVHGVPLEVGVAPIRYGFPAGVDAQYVQRKAKEFPNSNSEVLGGCVMGWKQVEVVAYCRKCREADPVAQIRVTSDAALAHARDVGAIEIVVMFAQYPTSIVNELVFSGDFNTETLMRLLRDGKGTILCAPRVLTLPGTEGIVKSTTEVRFPVACQDAETGTVTNRVADTNSVSEPASYEVREVGVRLVALPDLAEDGQSVAVTVMPEFTYPPEWRTNQTSTFTAEGARLNMTTEQPFFHTLYVSTQVKLPLGHTVLLGGGLPAKDKEYVVFMLLSAKIAQVPKEELSNTPSQDMPRPARQP